MKEQVASLRASLKSAPSKRPAAQTAKAIITAMRADLVKARRDKNWSTADLREWLAGEGVVVTEETLRKYLAAPRKGVGQDATVTLSMKRASNAARTLARGSVAKSQGVAASESVPRASSFSVRADTPDI